MPGMEGTDSKCPPTAQVRRGHPTVHSETKYVELIVVNDHQLVSSQPGDNAGRGPLPKQTWRLALRPLSFLPV